MDADSAPVDVSLVLPRDGIAVHGAQSRTFFLKNLPGGGAADAAFRDGLDDSDQFVAAGAGANDRHDAVVE